MAGSAPAPILVSEVLSALSFALDLTEGTKAGRTEFDRFGVVTSWIDGNSQDVYWDDIKYTARQE
jgi:hypothetical protein